MALGIAGLARAVHAGETGRARFQEFERLEARVEEKHRSDLSELERGIASQGIDPDAASDRRFKIALQYRRDLQALAREREAAVRLLEAEGRGSGDSSSQAGVPFGRRGLPKLPSQSVVTFPRDGQDATVAPPAQDAKETNVGLGVRELEF